ncbi:MAG: DNA polymerase beta subunit [Candidatus Magnetoglobus multicellularis str. Araruama]|uniref:DNA polymerase beta subunit n=1 Tax=Candidatus Magnetoglobus multicellularis str. Araruama TaxID=890399 RepID=A0A1V1P3K5_9BACT|nr:MAG: DNA polymerase beta subunit [Candidatus Magnetoglobus multicellularis str. Araruama]
MYFSKNSLKTYQATSQKKRINDQILTKRRYEKAWKTAHALSKILKKEFDVSETYLFGSLVYSKPELFHIYSDIDIGVRGLNNNDYYHAVARLMDCDFKVDLIMMESTSDRLRQRIKKEGIRL